MSKRINAANDPALFEFEPLPSERCPGCGRTSSAVLWAQDMVDGLRRTYRCTVCGKKWSVDGRQEDLFTVVGELTFEEKTA